MIKTKINKIIFCLLWLIFFIIGAGIAEIALSSPLTDAIQSEYEAGRLDEITAKILEHEFDDYLNRAMIAKCNRQSCDPKIILHHMLKMIASDRKKRSGHRYGFRGGVGYLDAVLIGLTTHAIIKSCEGPVNQKVKAVSESWRKERENEMHRMRYREREREERDRGRERERERARNHLIGIDRY